MEKRKSLNVTRMKIAILIVQKPQKHPNTSTRSISCNCLKTIDVENIASVTFITKCTDITIAGLKQCNDLFKYLSCSAPEMVLNVNKATSGKPPYRPERDSFKAKLSPLAATTLSEPRSEIRVGWMKMLDWP